MQSFALTIITIRVLQMQSKHLQQIGHRKLTSDAFSIKKRSTASKPIDKYEKKLYNIVRIYAIYMICIMRINEECETGF